MIYYVFCFGAIVHMANSVAKEADKIAVKIHEISSSGTISEELLEFVSRIWSQLNLMNHQWWSRSFIYNEICPFAAAAIFNATDTSAHLFDPFWICEIKLWNCDCCKFHVSITMVKKPLRMQKHFYTMAYFHYFLLFCRHCRWRQLVWST